MLFKFALENFPYYITMQKFSISRGRDTTRNDRQSLHSMLLYFSTGKGEKIKITFSRSFLDSNLIFTSV